MTTLPRLDRIALGVANPEDSLRFYRDLLGLRVEQVGDELHIPLGGTLLALIPAAPSERAKMQISFRMGSKEQVDEFEVALRRAGAHILSGPADRDGRRVLLVSDPDNYTIELYAE
ncbi:MAG: VOC family protein [bacterium]|nr:VOC family protein [bacterium]